PRLSAREWPEGPTPGPLPRAPRDGNRLFERPQGRGLSPVATRRKVCVPPRARMPAALAPSVKAAFGPDTPAVPVLTQDPVSVGQVGLEIARPGGCGGQACRTGQGLLAVGGHDGLPAAATRRRISAAAAMFLHDPGAPPRIAARPPGRRFDENLDLPC